MGFLKFLHKKKVEKEELVNMPLQPPEIGEGEAKTPGMPENEEEDAGLPAFPEGEETDELKLPELSELKEPEAPETTEPGKLPEAEEEFPVPKPSGIGEPIEFQSIPRFPPPRFLPPMFTRTGPFTPTEPPKLRQKAPETRSEIHARGLFNRETPTHPLSGDVFVKAEDYRELMEGLNEQLDAQKKKLTEEAKDAFRAEERLHERLVSAFEELQRSLVITENSLFETED